MTVKEKIFSINADFQKLYYDTSIDFFNSIIPIKLIIIREFINSVINEQHPLRSSVLKHIESIDYELKEMKEIAQNIKANFATKDNYVNSAKRNISQVLWRFHDDIWRFDANILSQIHSD